MDCIYSIPRIIQSKSGWMLEGERLGWGKEMMEGASRDKDGVNERM